MYLDTLDAEAKALRPKHILETYVVPQGYSMSKAYADRKSCSVR